MTKPIYPRVVISRDRGTIQGSAIANFDSVCEMIRRGSDGYEAGAFSYFNRQMIALGLDDEAWALMMAGNPLPPDRALVAYSAPRRVPASRKTYAKVDRSPRLGGLTVEQRRRIGGEILPDGRCLIRVEVAQNNLDVLRALKVNCEFWHETPELGGWVSPVIC